MVDVDAGDLVYAGDSVPMGTLVTYTIETTDSSTFTAETQISSVTFTAAVGYIYLIESGVQLTSATVTDIVQGSIRADTIAGAELSSGRCAAQTSDAARPVIIPLAYLYTSTTSGSKTFVVTGQRISGIGNVKREAGTTHGMLTTVRRVG